MITKEEFLNANILIVDDQASNVSLLEQLLEDAGYRSVTSTQDPRQASALHQANHYDLILLDLQMPGMDGFEVMEALKANDLDGYVPILVITAQPSHKLRALQGGAKDFISKPFDLVEVNTRIHNMLEVRLLYKKLETYNQRLEATVQERTAELSASEARFHRLTELASDWYWEQDLQMNFTKTSGPVLEMLGIRSDPLAPAQPANFNETGWDETERDQLRAMIRARQSVLNFVLNRTHPDGSHRRYLVSGEAMFNKATDIIGYCGIGVELIEGGRLLPLPPREESETLQ